MAPGIADKKNNALPMHGNEKTMNLNNLILTNILSSHYFKVNLYQLKTYHEVIDEIYYNVTHLEPWEKGSRKTSGQTGMCGGVRGVGAGGIVSTAFCILYKLFTLKLTRKQLVGLLNHCDSPYIRALGFMYIRYTQPPRDLWDWYEPYLEDAEEVDPKAGGGQSMSIGDLVRHLLTKLDWFSTLVPRIPVPIQKEIERKLSEHKPQAPVAPPPPEPVPEPGKEHRHQDDHRDHRKTEDDRKAADHHKDDEDKWANNNHHHRHNDRLPDDHRHGNGKKNDDHKSKKNPEARDKRNDDHHREKRSDEQQDHRKSERKSDEHREKKNDEHSRDRKNNDHREKRNDNHRRSHDREKRKRSSPDRRGDHHHHQHHHGSSKKEKLDIAEELARERDRQRKEHSSSHHRHRSRSPHRHHHHRTSKHH